MWYGTQLWETTQSVSMYEASARLREQPHMLRGLKRALQEQGGARASKDKVCMLLYDETMSIYPGVSEIYTLQHSDYLHYPSIPVPPLAASPCQTVWWWWWETDCPTESPAWTGPVSANPVEHLQTAVLSSPAILLDWTDLRLMSDWDRPDL